MPRRGGRDKNGERRRLKATVCRRKKKDCEGRVSRLDGLCGPEDYIYVLPAGTNRSSVLVPFLLSFFVSDSLLLVLGVVPAQQAQFCSKWLRYFSIIKSLEITESDFCTVFFTARDLIPR